MALCASRATASRGSALRPSMRRMRLLERSSAVSETSAPTPAIDVSSLDERLSDVSRGASGASASPSMRDTRPAWRLSASRAASAEGSGSEATSSPSERTSAP